MPRALHPTHRLLQIDGRYVCADNLRFASILTIVAIHSAAVLTVSAAPSPALELFRFAAVTLLKFGTIGFFLMSGFLLERNLRARRSLEVIERRFILVFLPWAFWFVLTCAVVTGVQFTRSTGAFLSGRPLPVALWMSLTQTFTSTAFWFVPNLMVALVVLLVFRRYVQSLWFGASLLAITLLYSANIYAGWIEAHHSRALFGFVFYLWLGHYAAVHIDRFSRLLHSIPMWLLSAATLSSALVAFAEGRLLLHLRAVDPLNTLKISTQIFSLLVFLCFFRYERRIWPAFIDVPRNAFGMYLVHVITFVAFMSPLRALINRPGSHPLLDSFAVRVALWVTAIVLVAGTSYVLANFVSARPWLSWMVGSPRQMGSAQSFKKKFRAYQKFMKDDAAA